MYIEILFLQHKTWDNGVVFVHVYNSCLEYFIVFDKLVCIP